MARANEGDVVTVYADESPNRQRGRQRQRGGGRSTAAQKLFKSEDNKDDRQLPDVVDPRALMSEDEDDDDDVGEAADQSAEEARAKAVAAAARRVSPRQNRRAPDYYQAA